MTIKRIRICIFCRNVGKTETFDTGNALKKHVKIYHPRTKQQIGQDHWKLRRFRTEFLLKQGRLRRRPK
jgi:hypothetical protein